MNDELFFELFRQDADRALRAEKTALQAEADEPVAFSPAFEARMDTLCRRMETGKYRKVYGKARALLIAAIVTLFLMTATAGAAYWRAVVQYDPDWGENVFHVDGGMEEKLPADPRPAYIPDRFTKTVAETRADDNYQLVMEAANGDILAVTVRPAADDHLLFDAKHGEYTWIDVDGKPFYRRRSVTETEQHVYTTILISADDRYIVTAAIWDHADYADDALLAKIINSVLLKEIID